MKRHGAVLLSLALVACDKSLPTEVRSAVPSASPTRTPALTATPIPLPQIAGFWGGDFDGLCRFDSYRTHVTATLQQEGDLVTGSFSSSNPVWAASCNFNHDFTGRLSGHELVGTLGTITVTGSVASGVLRLHLTNGTNGALPELIGDLTLLR